MKNNCQEIWNIPNECIYLRKQTLKNMCVVSMIGDDFSKRIQDDEWWKKLTKPTITPNTPNSIPPIGTPPYQSIDLGLITRSEFEALKREVEQLKELLKRAVEYDKRNNEPHCEMDEKVAMIKKIAEAFGVDLSEVFKTN